mmetsp:Transcript_45619/g.89864  ORF Transcript_45619/g.89864 Transcript_45619/m.89864 type:complete len:90 (-) Transcript_45619:162-431(-)
MNEPACPTFRTRNARQCTFLFLEKAGLHTSPVSVCGLNPPPLSKVKMKKMTDETLIFLIKQQQAFVPRFTRRHAYHMMLTLKKHETDEK